MYLTVFTGVVDEGKQHGYSHQRNQDPEQSARHIGEDQQCDHYRVKADGGNLAVSLEVNGKTADEHQVDTVHCGGDERHQYYRCDK